MRILHPFVFFSIKFAGGTSDLMFKIAKAQKKAGLEPIILSGSYKFDDELADSLVGVECIKLRSWLDKFGIYHSNSEFRRIRELECIPSPYLSGSFDRLIEAYPENEWLILWETNRGCPFQCTFCDWGSATKTKVRKWDMDKLFEEIEWFADNKIPYIDCCDANFGIFTDRDLSLAKKLSSEKK